ncbi:MAG TPA: Uma2 family endonuclease [Longimicrobium sp.]|nr:Uma2 family endonuclease [Longimicrobium sp.]
MATQPHTAFVTLDDFLATVEVTEDRSEYVDGRVVAMAGASFAHNVIVQNISGMLYSRLRGGPCRVLGQGMLLKPKHAENAFLPDVLVVCGQPQIEHRHADLLMNPVLLIEVLSPSTADYDHGKKWENYRRIPTVQDYLLVSQDRPRVERYTRHGDGLWLFSETAGVDGEIRLDSVNAALPLAEIYEGVPASEARSAESFG